MRLELSSPIRRHAFLVGCAGLLIAFWALCCQMIAAHWMASNNTPTGLALAARVQPLNAEYEEKLGILYMDPNYADFDSAVTHFERAAAIDPHSSSIWLSLARAADVKGDSVLRENALRHAIASEPKDTQVQWEAANFFTGSDPDRTLQLLRGVIENDAQYTLPAIRVAMHATKGDVEKAMQAVPASTSARLQVMHWLIDRNETDAADRVWPTVLSSPGSLKLADSFFYLDSLIARRHPVQALAAWSALVQREASLAHRRQPGNLLFNGDFEENLVNGGFGWRYTPTSGVTASLDTSDFHSGTRSMSLQVDGVDLQDLGLSELVVVDAGSHYAFSAWLHGEELEAAHGIRVAVTDAYTNLPLQMSDEVLGSFPWRQVSGDFIAPTETQLVRVSIVRSPSTGRIRGRLWIDDLRMERR